MRLAFGEYAFRVSSFVVLSDDQALLCPFFRKLFVILSVVICGYLFFFFSLLPCDLCRHIC